MHGLQARKCFSFRTMETKKRPFEGFRCSAHTYNTHYFALVCKMFSRRVNRSRIRAVHPRPAGLGCARHGAHTAVSPWLLCSA
jgi:hypothetical protein